MAFKHEGNDLYLMLTPQSFHFQTTTSLLFITTFTGEQRQQQQQPTTGSRCSRLRRGLTSAQGENTFMHQVKTLTRGEKRFRLLCVEAV